jgi:hypothetical protein
VFDRFFRVSESHLFAVQPYRATVEVVGSEKRRHDLPSSSTKQSRESENLPLVNGKGDILEDVPFRETFYGEKRLRASAKAPAVEGRQVSTDHHFDKLLMVSLGGQFGSYISAVTEDRHPVRNLEDLVEPVPTLPWILIMTSAQWPIRSSGSQPAAWIGFKDFWPGLAHRGASSVGVVGVSRAIT